MSDIDQQSTPYPVTFDIEYAEKQSRLKALFRIILVIPIFLWVASFDFYHDLIAALHKFQVIVLVQKIHAVTSDQAVHYINASHIGRFSLPAITVCLLPVFLMILFRKKYPKWIFDFNAGFYALMLRFSTYFFCLTDEYPNSDQNGAVKLNIAYPATGTLNRLLPFVKWFLAIPHYVCIFVLGIAALIVVIIGWFSILIVGRYPRALFDFAVGCYRWNARVAAYAFLFFTDQYPPFSLK